MATETIKVPLSFKSASKGVVLTNDITGLTTGDFTEIGLISADLSLEYVEAEQTSTMGRKTVKKVSKVTGTLSLAGLTTTDKVDLWGYDNTESGKLKIKSTSLAKDVQFRCVMVMDNGDLMGVTFPICKITNSKLLSGNADGGDSVEFGTYECDFVGSKEISSDDFVVFDETVTNENILQFLGLAE